MIDDTENTEQSCAEAGCQSECDVMLYAWKPKGHGQYSFFVAAKSEEEARKAVEKHMEENCDIGGYEKDGWRTDYYKLTVLPAGVATSNPND